VLLLRKQEKIERKIEEVHTVIVKGHVKE
jgi:hypothetical protein